MPQTIAEKAAAIVRDAGGRIVGRTRFQKVAYLLSAAGLDESFNFEYRHYGPYSENLAIAARIASLTGEIKEEEHQASWGGKYSIFSVDTQFQTNSSELRSRLATIASGADALMLELAATAVFLAREGYVEPWTETARRKPEKAEEGRLDKAKQFYLTIRELPTPQRLPQI